MNKKFFIRLLCTVFVIAMLLPAVIACGKTEEPAETNTDTQEIITDDANTDFAPTPYTDDFGGYEFKVLTRKGGLYESNDITADISGNVVDQAVYTRNARLEQKYNFKIVEIKSSNYVEEAQKVGGAGEAAYDMWSFAMNSMASLGQEGYLYNLNEVAGLNLDAPYYDQNTRENASFAGYLFTITGDMLTADDISTNVTLMNKDLYEKYKLEEIYGDIYEVVLNGKWTFEKMKVYASRAAFDDDGDGVMTKNDYWAGSAQAGHLGNFYIAFGHDLLKKTSDDTLVLNDDPALITKLQDTIEYLRGSTHYWKNDMGGDLYNYGKQLFWYCQIAHIPSVRAAGVENIVLPNAKYDEDQTDYYTFVPCYGSNCISICSTVKNVDLVASIIELTSYESMDTVTPALMEYLIGGRILDNANDVQVMQLILDTRTYSYNEFWNTGAASGLQTQLAAGSTDIAHVFAACKDEVNASVQRKLERLQRLG